MRKRKIPGLFKIGEIWHIDKVVNGRRINKSTGTSDFVEAQQLMAMLIDQARRADVFGERPKIRLSKAIERYSEENQHLSSIKDNEAHLKLIQEVIGDLYIDQIFDDTVSAFIKKRHKDGKKSKTVNIALGVLRRLLKLASGKWRHSNGLTWLETMPIIENVKWQDARKPFTLSYDDQAKLFNYLPAHLQSMVLFKVNTGCREQEVCQLRWEWECELLGSDEIVFILPEWVTKTKVERVVVINQDARKAIESVRGIHEDFVFSYRGHSLTTINNSGWKTARRKADLPLLRVHDLKHTYGRRLRAADVRFEDRQDLLGHKNGNITTHYSEAELRNLIVASNKICQKDGNSRNIHEAVVLIRKKAA
jgi:integrase